MFKSVFTSKCIVYRFSNMLLVCLFALIVVVDAWSNSKKVTQNELEKACAFVVAPNGANLGTGFFISIDDSKEQLMLFFVTAKHVVEGDGLFEKPESMLVLRVNTEDEIESTVIRFHLALSSDRPWFEHATPGVDLAIFPVYSLRLSEKPPRMLCLPYHNRLIINRGAQLSMWSLWPQDKPNFLIEPFRQIFGIKAGAEVFTLGLVPYIMGRSLEQNLPNIIMHRYGRIAAIPKTPLMNLSTSLVQTIILDCPAVPGNSGSPVFVYVDESDTNNKSFRNPHLLGVVSSGCPDIESGLTTIVPVDYIVDIISSDAVLAYQKQISGFAEHTNNMIRDLLARKDALQERQKELGVMLVKAKKEQVTTEEIQVLIDKIKADIRNINKSIEEHIKKAGPYFQRYKKVSISGGVTNAIFAFP